MSRASNSSDVSIGPTTLPGQLSIRAENVLKILAPELTGEVPPRGRWTPSDRLLQRLTYKHLSTARNCGAQTTAEIIRWAQTRGTTIRRSFYAGKSLAVMWHEAIAKFSTGEISRAEIAEALEKSTRRKNTRVPVALQKILLQLIRHFQRLIFAARRGRRLISIADMKRWCVQRTYIPPLMWSHPSLDAKLHRELAVAHTRLQSMVRKAAEKTQKSRKTVVRKRSV